MMGSTFGSITDATQALNATRYALDVVQQNISNADTPGYVRQRADLAEVGPVAGAPTLYATGRTGSGVTVSGVTRMNDPVLDARQRTEHGRNEALLSQTGTLGQLENLFNEPSDSGLSEQLNTFWSSWGAVANNPGSIAARNVVLQQATGLATSLNQYNGVLTSLTQTTSAQLGQAVTDINTAAASLATVNKSIAIATAAGTPSNALLDQRDQLLMKLTSVGGATTVIQPNGTADVLIGGQNVVTGTTTTLVGLTGNVMDVGGVAVAPVDGTAGGLLNSLTSVLPSYQAQLDAVANTLATTMNNAQAAGFDLNGNPGAPMFTGTTAATITMSLAGGAGLAASGTPGGNLDASNALAIASFGTQNNSPDASYHALIGNLASQSGQVQQAAQTQASVTDSVDALVQSSDGVSLDEETSNMLTYQRAYQAAARVLTTVDSTLDQLINHTGRVGIA